MNKPPDRAVELAAQAIVDLINSRPTSPRKDEIADIIARLADATPASASKRLNAEYGPIIFTRSP